jgi:hypothetical protein
MILHESARSLQGLAPPARVLGPLPFAPTRKYLSLRT